MARTLFVAVSVLTTFHIVAGAAHAEIPGWLERSVDREVARLTVPPPAPPFKTVQQQPALVKRNWIQRHPVLFVTLVGFGVGFLIGFLPGDDAVLDDFDASFNGLVIGGVGALAGAIVGEVTTR
jgi:hypothetical protein